MFKSDIFDIRKVRFRSNIKCFEYFGQPTFNSEERGTAEEEPMYQ